MQGEEPVITRRSSLWDCNAGPAEVTITPPEGEKREAMRAKTRSPSPEDLVHHWKQSPGARQR